MKTEIKNGKLVIELDINPIVSKSGKTILVAGSAGFQQTSAVHDGKHKGEPMQDVPANYLHWLWTNGKKDDKQCPVADYIRRNLNALKQEHRDGVWT